MSVPSADSLRDIKTFPQLVKYLHEELDWPIKPADFEDLTFDFEPEELGLKEEYAAKLGDSKIKQLRPLSDNQPWGIFFIDFKTALSAKIYHSCSLSQ